MIMQGQVGNPGTTNLPDSEISAPVLGRQRELLTSSYHGERYNANYRDKLFHAVSVVGGNSFPIYSATALVFALWNASADVNLELVRFTAAYVSGTGVAGPFGYQWKNVGTTVGVPLSAFTHVASGIISGKPGGGAVSKAQFANSAATIVAAPTANFIPSKMGQMVITAADTTQGVYQLEEEFKGDIILEPGILFFPAALLASVSLFAMKLTYIEVPR